MAEVKWIKIVTDIFDDEKILLIESLPESDSLIVIWFKLLCLAGKQNNSGVFMMNDKIPYTEEMLAAIFRRPLNTVKLALKTFEDFGMIEIVDGVITISNWDKHQSLDQLELAREQTRKRVAKHRAKQKQKALGLPETTDVTECNVTCNAEVTQSNADRIRLDIDIDKDKDIDKEKDIKKKNNTTKHKHGEYNHVLLTDNEYKKLEEQYGSSNLQTIITYLDEYLEMKGTKYKSHYMVIKKWGAEAALKKEREQTASFFKSFLES
jgi:predicted phage replisome organizer